MNAVAEPLRTECVALIDFLSDANIIKLKSVLDEMLKKENEEYRPHSLEDFSPETQQALIDADNGVNLYGPFDTWAEAVADMDRADIDREIK